MTIVNRETGEITEPTTALATIDKSSASVVTLLEQAKSWLATCVEMTGPAEIAAAKAQIVTAETYARELRLSKDIQLDAQEMVRRAEYALGKSIRKGQIEGTIRTTSESRSLARKQNADSDVMSKPSVSDIDRSVYDNGSQVLSMVDGVAPADFDAALTEAKAEGNLSRANVVRKIKGESSPTVLTREQRADVIRDLAEQGYSSRQMPARVGVTEETVRQIARDFGIEIPADKAIGRTRRLDHTQMVENSVTAFENSVSALQYIDFNEVDFGQADEWVASLAASISELRKFKNRIAKEATHVV